MKHFTQFIDLLFTCLYKKIDRNTLHDVEHVLVNATIRCSFLLFAVAVQINGINLIIGFQQVPSHSSKGRIV